MSSCRELLTFPVYFSMDGWQCVLRLGRLCYQSTFFVRKFKKRLFLEVIVLKYSPVITSIVTGQKSLWERRQVIKYC